MGIQERKERERERRRQQILVAAKNVFSQKGINKSTMEDIARAAELSPGTLYLYFKNKDELYASLCLRILQYLLIRLKETQNKKKIDFKKRFELLKEAITDVYEFDPLMFVKLFHLQSDESFQHLTPQLHSEINDLSEKSLGVIANFFKTGMDSHVFIDNNPDTLAEIMWAFFSGIVLLEEKKKILGKNSNLKLTLKTAFDIFFRGITIR